MDSEYKFRIELLETTKLNVETVRDSLLQAAQYGMPVKSALASTLGVTQSNLNNMAFLENEIMNLPDNLIPLSSSHTQSVKSAGAPKKKKMLFPIKVLKRGKMKETLIESNQMIFERR